MNRNSVSAQVRNKIERGGPDRLWTFADFKAMPPLAVAAALSRFAKSGNVRRLRKGVYYVTRETRFGSLTPDPGRVAARLLDQRNVKWTPSGLPMYNALGLTTQISSVPTFSVDRRVGSLRTGLFGRVRLRTAHSFRALTGGERAVLDALRDLRSIPDTTPGTTVKRIIDLIKSGRIRYDQLLKVARHEPPRVRALLGLIGTEISKHPDSLKGLRDSLNGTTSFKLGLGDTFPAARDWGIR